MHFFEANAGHRMSVYPRNEGVANGAQPGLAKGT
jgi:hypothetical protein